ncbi:SgcJ/EcaC family oxidoreductase [Phenylobacterium sp.]|uniref:SgcJ/EcaC family oxidoreductase n=1 Tax=Phenylobacterium sp. TaxID=1871053 RepID=UPI002ED839DA
MSQGLMVRAASLAVCWLLLTAASPADTPKSGERAEDRAQIARLLADWETAWNTHDMRRLAALFQEDAVWVLWTGDVWTGRARFEAGMTEVHKTVYRNSVQREHLEELRFVGPDAAVLRFQSTLTGDTRFPDRTVRSRKILVLTRADGAWRIGWGQNTRFAADMQLPPSAAPR